MIPKPTNEITYDDIIQFCKKGIPENMVLDYKRNFPKDLAKIISAFANTWGGTIIIGVEEDGGVPSKYEGIDFDPQLEDRVTQSVVNSVTPIFLPEIKVCRNDDDKAFVFIRIHQSEISPHAINDNKRVYIRTGSTSKPCCDLADLDEIDFLKNRRAKSADLLDSVLETSLSYYRELGALHLKKEQEEIEKKNQDKGNDFHDTLASLSPSIKNVGPLYPDLEISMYPKYLHRKLTSKEEILESLNTRNYQADNYRGVDAFPSFDSKRSVVAGVATSKENKQFCYFNEYGYISYLEDIFKFHSKEEEYHLFEIFFNIDNFLDHALKFYNDVKYYGHIELNLRLSIPSDYKLKGLLDTSKMFEDDMIDSINDLIIVNKVFTLSELKHGYKQILIKIFLELFWSLGFSYYKEEHIESVFTRNRGEFS